MRRVKSIITLILVQLIAINISYSAIINETIKNSCPDDPTFNGKCHLKEEKTDGYSCKEINGVNVCKDWWKKEYIYECDGEDNSAIFNTFIGQSYCHLETECSQWEDIDKEGGRVSCRVYLDKYRPDCADNPNQAKCVADDCGDLAKRCSLEEYIPYGDLPDKANPTTTRYCDPVSGGCGYQEVPDTSGINLGTYIYNCPSSVKKICRKYETKIKCPAECPDGTKKMCPAGSNQVRCPDGSIAECKEDVCNTVKTCKRYENRQIQGTEIKTCNAPRNYTDYNVIKDSDEDKNLANNPMCLAIDSFNDTQQMTGRFAWGWDGDCGDDCGSCESYMSGLVVDGYPVWSSNGCYKVSDSSGIFPDSAKIRAAFTKYFQDFLGINATVIGVDNISETGSYSGAEACFGADCSPRRFRQVQLIVAIPKVKYRCFSNSIDVSNCSTLESQCELQDNINDLSSLSCNNIMTDIQNPSKKLCSIYAIQYECPAIITKRDCLEWETKQVCNGVVYPMKDVEIESKDFTADFAKAQALAQLANELKHVWSGEYKRCDSGWFSSVFQNPMEYLKQKFIGFVVSKLGSQFLSAASEFANNYIGKCATPTGNSTEAIQNCVSSSAQDAATNGSSQVQDLMNKMTNNGAIQFLSSPYGQFAVQVAIDILTTTQKCNACTSKSCAENHNMYDTYGLLKGGNCHFVESGCAWKVNLGFDSICLRKKYMYCCYDSVFARILVEQAYKQLGYSFAGGNCSALTFEDIKKLDFDQMDWSELQEYLTRKAKGQIDPNLIKDKINNYFDSDYGNPQFNGEVPYSN